MNVRILIGVVLVPTLLLAACAPKAAATPKAGTAATAIRPTANATLEPTKRAGTTPITLPTVVPTHETTATPAGSTSSKPPTALTPASVLFNDLSVENQMIQSDHVLVGFVDAMKPGWVAIFTDDKGQPGTVLGYLAVPSGVSEDLEVPIDTSKATDKMIAMLLTDQGKVGSFEYPGPDTPIDNANINGHVMAVFSRLSAASH